MKLNQSQKLILYSLGCFYQSLNQPLITKPVQARTSKITFIELLLSCGIVSKKERALYHNLESLEKKKLIEYQQKMIKFTYSGIAELQKISKEIQQYLDVENHFKTAEKPRRKVQTVMK